MPCPDTNDSQSDRLSDADMSFQVNSDGHVSSSELIRVKKFPQSFLYRIIKRSVNYGTRLIHKVTFGSFGSRSRINFPSWTKGKQSVFIGENVHVWRFSRITAINPERGRRIITISDDCIIHPSIHISAVSSVHIGRSVLIAANCYITDHDHKWQDVDTPAIRNEFLIAQETRIGDHVWIGEGAMVLKGVSIGDNCIIGAGSVVTKSIPPFSLAVGNPARVLKTYDHEAGAWISVAPLSGSDLSKKKV